MREDRTFRDVLKPAVIEFVVWTKWHPLVRVAQCQGVRKKKIKLVIGKIVRRKINLTSRTKTVRVLTLVVVPTSQS